MMIMIRSTFLAATLAVATVLPAAAQQAGSDAAVPAAEAAPAAQAADMNAIVQQLQRDLQALTEAARDSARNFVNRESPYVIPTDQLAAIAAGAVAGAIVIDLLGGGGLATLTGAAVGGVAGHWLYTHPDTMPRQPMTAPTTNGTRGG